MAHSFRILRYTLGLAVVTAAALGSAGPAQAAAPACQPVGAAPPDGHHSCLAVDAELSAAPAVGETATLTYEVQSGLTGDAVRISVELPPHLRWRTAPAGTEVASRESAAPQARGTVQRAESTRAFTAGESARFSGVVEAVAAGPAEIQARVEAAVPYGVEAGADAVLLTIAPAGQSSRMGIVSSNRAAAVEYRGATPVVDGPAVKAADDKVRPPAAGEAPPLPSDRSGQPATERADGEPAVAATSCVTGSWNFADKNGVYHGARQWRVEAWDDDSSTGNGNDFLASGLTGFDGRYTLCFNSSDIGGTGTQDVYVVFFADNGNWRVQAPTGVYNYGSGVVWNVPGSATRDIGWLQPADPAHHRGAQAFQAVSDAWNGTPGACWDLVSACRAVIINWSPGATGGAFYSGSANQVFLPASAPDSPTVVVHETAHSIMDDVYDDATISAPNCNPHSITAPSSQGCAWREGFAEWFPAQIYNDPFFRWADGSSLNLETPTWDTPGWSNFDAVEGRVAGAMIDLSDSHNEGFDTYTEGMYNLWSTFQWHNSGTFQQFWTHRAADGFNVGQSPRSALHQNTIDY
ncbi:MAG: hypothetical protein ABW022_15495 [Actinoplanes sp.]